MALGLESERLRQEEPSPGLKVKHLLSPGLPIPDPEAAAATFLKGPAAGAETGAGAFVCVVLIASG